FTRLRTLDRVRVDFREANDTALRNRVHHELVGDLDFCTRREIDFVVQVPPSVQPRVRHRRVYCTDQLERNTHADSPERDKSIGGASLKPKLYSRQRMALGLTSKRDARPSAVPSSLQ